jgi:ribosomal protein L12E/L44/L45/RPP1/RPP2
MTDLSDIGLCSINVREYNYNMIINLVQQKNWEEALKKINDELTQASSSSDQAKNVK